MCFAVFWSSLLVCKEQLLNNLLFSFAATIFAPYLLLQQQWSRLVSVSNLISFKSAYSYGDSWSRVIYKGASGWKSGERVAHRYHAFRSRPANCPWCTEYSTGVLAITCYQLLQITLRVGSTSDWKQKWVILPKRNYFILHPSFCE